VLAVLGFAVLALGVVAVGLAIALGENLRYVELAQPVWLWLGLLPFVALGARTGLSPRPATLRFSRVGTLRRLSAGIAAHLAELPDGLRFAAALLLVGALARPQSSRLSDRVEHEGIDIAIALDLSESMQSPDVFPTRLEASKAVIDDFIRRRPRDRISVVAFGASASTVAPLTSDHDVVRALVARLELKVIDGTRTAIGAGLGVALNRLEESEAESRVIVLLTDGVHNAGGISPDTVAEEAASRGIHVYTVLMGKHGGRGMQSIDPAQLERIASVTGGYAYTAEDRDALATTFQDLLDKLEKSVIESNQVRAELFAWLLWPALLLLLLDVLLRTTRLRRFP
jgi:Ca-activated chloride channel family protein